MLKMVENYWFFLICAFFVGACFGSFINAAAYRIVRGQDWMSAPSRCFSCDKKLTWHQNVPLFGWLRHLGKAVCCEASIPASYFWVEFVAGLLLVGHLIVFNGLITLVFLPFLILCGIIFLTDMEAFHIPDIASLGGTALGLIFVLAELPGLPSLRDALIGGILGFAMIYAINLSYRLWRGVDGMGFGDVKLMAMFGVWLGPMMLLPILFLASTVGAAAGICFILAQKMSGNRSKTSPKSDITTLALPFGCFLVPAALFLHFFDITPLLGLAY